MWCLITVTIRAVFKTCLFLSLRLQGSAASNTVTSLSCRNSQKPLDQESSEVAMLYCHMSDERLTTLSTCWPVTQFLRATVMGGGWLCCSPSRGKSIYHTGAVEVRTALRTRRETPPSGLLLQTVRRRCKNKSLQVCLTFVCHCGIESPCWRVDNTWPKAKMNIGGLLVPAALKGQSLPVVKVSFIFRSPDCTLRLWSVV